MVGHDGEPGARRRALTAAARAVGRFLLGGPAGSNWRSPVLGAWQDEAQPAAHALRLERDARRDDRVQPLPPVEAVVADGLLMAHAAVRMSLKNHVIVAELRDHRAFDRASFAAFARRELLRLAAESEQTAVRLDPIVAALPEATGGSLAQRLEREEQARRPLVHRLLATALRDAADESDLLAALVLQAEEDVREELGEAAAAEVGPRPPRDGEHGARRAGRIRFLIGRDLAALQRRRGSRPAHPRGRWAPTRDRS